MTWDDQQNINKFGRLNNKFHELEDEIKAKKVAHRHFCCRDQGSVDFVESLG